MDLDGASAAGAYGLCGCADAGSSHPSAGVEARAYAAGFARVVGKFDRVRNFCEVWARSFMANLLHNTAIGGAA